MICVHHENNICYPTNDYHLAKYIRAYLILPLTFLKSFFQTLDVYLSKKKMRVILSHLFLLLILLLLINLTLTRAYFPEYIYRPDNKAMQQIYWIYNRYGFSNNSIIVPIFNPPARPINPRSSTNIVGWSRGYLGDSIYVGSLFSLFEGVPDIFNHTFDVEQKDIILASQLYKISSFESLLCKKISDLGIYLFDLRNISKLEDVLIRRANWIDYGFKKNWGIRTNTLNASVNSKYPNYTSIKIPRNINESGWFTIEYKMNDIPVLNISTLVIMLAGTLSTSRLTIEVYNSKYAFTGKKIYALNTTHYWIVLPLREGELLQKIRFSIYNNGTRSSVSEYLNIYYLALI